MVSLNRSIGSLWHSKEGAYEGRQFLQLPEVRKNQSLQVVGAGYGLFSNAMMLQVIPDLLVGVEFWRVWWKVKKLLDKVIPVRLSADKWEELRREARELGVGPTTLARMWLLERLRQRVKA